MIPNDTIITPEIVASHGLKPDEYDRLLALLGRTPTMTELGITSAMWNEHCSYKSSRVHLKTLPTKGPRVIHGPGENAGVVDIGDGMAVVFKMESHNHPSYIEPYQGAATGVGGILRDVFTMGARPIACLNALRFGAPEHPRTRRLVAGVVAGIAGYGNAFGVPTVGGEVNFHSAYDGNCLVNAMAVGIARTNAIFTSEATGVGRPIVYLGSKTGRDGIHGATMASDVFSEGSDEKRPTVQVGDPFAEKLLLEACLELMATGAVIAIQDMGAAGLTCSAVEMGAKGGLGVQLDLEKVPTREPGMTPYEIMLSESQERMLMVLDPAKEAIARAVFIKWGLDFAVVGHTTDTGRFVISMHGDVYADMPIQELGDQSPLYTRPWVASVKRPTLAADSIKPPCGTLEALQRMVATPDLASRRWVWEHYDHVIGGDTVQLPGGDAAIVRIEGGAKALAMTTDVTPRYCVADPFEGGKQAVAEAWRNLCSVGALPIALTDNLNFGSPERPEIMGQFVGCVRGIGEAARVLDFPVVSGNVSLYNENKVTGNAILPTPAIGGVGLIEDWRKTASVAFKAKGHAILLIGGAGSHLGASIYLRELLLREDGAPPPVDLEIEKRNGDAVRHLIGSGLVKSCHDVSDGGLLVAVAEMAMAGGIGARLKAEPKSVPAHAWFFGEDQARYVLAVAKDDLDTVMSKLQAAETPVQQIGETAGRTLTISRHGSISLGDLLKSHEGWFPAYMNAAN
jgi:phosphoribosylformylglycinamidine synthase subunit PurL